MYVKLYSKILDSSLANDRRLRHFFTDLLLLADPEGNVILTKEAIARRLPCDLSEVEWGIAELMKPEEGSHTLENEGRRIEPLEGHGYGWKILNYAHYRALKSAKELREATRVRVQMFRAKKKMEAAATRKPSKKPKSAPERADDPAWVGEVPITTNPERSIKNWDTHIGAGGFPENKQPEVTPEPGPEVEF